MTTFCFSVSSSVVHLDVFLAISYMRTHVVDTFLHQAIDRSRRHHNTCSGMTNRVLIDDGARWILQGDEQERENRTAWCQSSLQHAGGRLLLAVQRSS